uniref:Uncharacterized protein n=1 Tax=viral metagenome TaxID=1070528 RepID=A0A6C0CRP4_9ZZZZ
MSLSPAPLTQHQMLSIGENSVGPYTQANNSDVNFNQNPTTLPSNKILIKKNAYAGTKSNCAAAKGKYVKYQDGNKIGGYNKMKGGNKLSLDPTQCKDPTNPRHNPDPSSYDPVAKKGGKRRRTMKKRKSMRKHKKHSKRHHKRSRKMHKKHKKHTRKHKKHHKKHSRKHKKHTRKHKKHSRRHRMRGGKVGGPQPFSNVPISFGYSANLSHLKPSMSAVANPVPFKAYEACGKVSRA